MKQNFGDNLLKIEDLQEILYDKNYSEMMNKI